MASNPISKLTEEQYLALKRASGVLQPDHVRVGPGGAANLGRSRPFLGGQSRLKAGCGQYCPPHN
jgi:hypothetical protein